MKTNRMIGFVLAALFGVAFARAQVTEAASKAPSGPSAEAKARLDAAAATVEALKGTKGPERLDGMRAAAGAYEGVARDFGQEQATVARALWEAGECWRRAGDLEPAAAAYGRALGGEPGRYRQRLLFELGGVLRRLKRYDEALASYSEAGKIEVEGVRAHDARIWVGRVQELRGEAEAAVAAYRSAVDSAVGPRRTIEACDALAKALVRRGDLDGARAAVEHADTAARPFVDQGGQEGERIARALEEMGARRQLQRAVDRKTGAAKDAVRLEEERGGGR